MANRPVFSINNAFPYYKKEDIDFEWHRGHSLAQKQRCVDSLHSAYTYICPNAKVLEASTRSKSELGQKLSALNLKMFVKSIGKEVSVENIFQSSKVFENKCQYLDLLEELPWKIKKDERLSKSGLITKFIFEGKEYPIIPKTVFYDYIYINALLENKELIEELIKYDSFTDISFNPKKSINCQALSLAKFVSFYKLGLCDKLRDFDEFYKLTSNQ